MGKNPRRYFMNSLFSTLAVLIFIGAVIVYLKGSTKNNSPNFNFDYDSSSTKVIPDWEIIVVSGKKKVQQVEMTVSIGKEYLIGRDNNCNLVLNDPYVGRCQLGVYHDQQGYFVDVLGKTCRTYVNGHEADQFPLADGLEVQIGYTKLIFKSKPNQFDFDNSDTKVREAEPRVYGVRRV